ncbi:MAG TPA: PH domain-containing protein [Gillisia sp.]|nr:PH domain-containing protein [Gillisia sp.]
MKFKSRRDLFFNLMIFGAIAVLLAPIYSLWTGGITTGTIAFMIYCIAVSCFLLWFFYGTWYTIDSKQITYHSGPFKGKIEIEKINKVIIGKNLYIGFRPATAFKGVIVKYGRYDEIYFSPQTNETFIAELLKIKPEIKIEKNERV